MTTSPRILGSITCEHRPAACRHRRAVHVRHLLAHRAAAPSARLLRHYDRLRVTHPGELPIVQLRKSGFTSKKKGVGWVDVPAFVIIGRWPANGAAAKPPDTPMRDLLDDEITFK